jgi:phosphate transport system permease protein
MSADHALFGAGIVVDTDQPRVIAGQLSGGDRVFRGALRGAGLAVLAITGLIGVFLVIEARRALGKTGFHFLTTETFNPSAARFGIASLLPNGIFIATIALIVAVPIAIGTALFISEYAPVALRRPMIALVDLMAAIPSILYGLWGVAFLEPRIYGTSRWMATHLAWIPFFKVPGGHTDNDLTGSTFVAGLVVSLMVIPIVASISREVFSRAPAGEREAAYALGSSRWGMVRSVVLPYGRGGMIGAIMLGFGRAMGETIAIALIISPTYSLAYRVLENHGLSIASLIALRYSESTPLLLSSLMAAGLVLFLVTLAVNALAAVVVNRSRSGADTG